jgi:hypothetical protein
MLDETVREGNVTMYLDFVNKLKNKREKIENDNRNVNNENKNEKLLSNNTQMVRNDFSENKKQ